MSAALFAVPLPGSRCLSPLPHSGPAAFKKGDLVAWSDGEHGVVLAADEHRVSIAWEESQGCAVLETEAA